MANKNLFQTIVGKLLPKTDVVNEAGGTAYAFDPQLALAQYALTGCLNQTFYTAAEAQLEAALELCKAVEPQYVAQVAIYARRNGHMKDMPALLSAYLSVAAPELLAPVFREVMDDARMVRTFVQIIRSGQVGRKSLGSLPKKLILEWLDSRTEDALFRASVGADPSLADIVKMVHPKPKSKARAAFYGYLIGKPYDPEMLSSLVRDYEAFKASSTASLPDVPFQMLTALPLTAEHWKQIARNASWQTTRMNLNTFERHGVFEDPQLVTCIAERLADRASVRKARNFPYQLLAAYKMTSDLLPNEIREALQDAMESATENVPKFEGRIAVFPDVSGSMQSSVSGNRKGATSAVRCIDVAALFAACIIRKNPDAIVLPFENQVVSVKINPRDSVMTNAQSLANIGGGGTSCSAPLARLNKIGGNVDLVVYISDNQSWVDASQGTATSTMQEWNKLKRQNPNARMVCIDIQPFTHSQARCAPDVLNIGGFSDHVFSVIEGFSRGEQGALHLTKKIREVELRTREKQASAA